MMTRRTLLSSLAASAAVQAAAAAASPSTRIRAAQIGTEHAHAFGKMEAVRRLSSDYEVLGIAGKPSKAADYAGLPWLSEEAILSNASLRLVLVETRVEDSCRTAHAAIRAGKAIHLDKPGALVHAEFIAMRREAEQRGLAVQMGYMLRHNPAFELLFRAVKEGWLGEIREIDASIGKLADPATRQKLAALKGGGMYELGCHVIDAAMTVLGKPKAIHAFSSPSRDDGILDNQLAVFEYPRATATIRCNHADPFGGPHRRFAVKGSEGALEILPLESGKFTLTLSKAQGSYRKGPQTVELTVPKGRYDGEFIELAKVVRGEKALAWNAEHDIAVHDAVLRASGAV